jgi:type VI secretion system protein ImpB
LPITFIEGGQRMPKDSSVAPRERVNITYRVANGDRQQELELPLKVLVMGDFISRTDPTPLEERQPVNVSKDNFAQVLAAHDLSVDVRVTDELSGAPNAETRVSLKLRSLHDFTPEGIAQQVPELRDLLELRKALTALKHPLADLPKFRARIMQILSDEKSRARLMRELGLEPSEKR